MRYWTLMLLAGLAGCTTMQPPPGWTLLKVGALAVPKVGVVQNFRPVPTYDAPPPPAVPMEFERLDYGSLDDIIVWVEAEGKPGVVGEQTIELNLRKPAVHVIPVSVGQELNFKEPSVESDIHVLFWKPRLQIHELFNGKHGIYSVSDGNEFDLTKADSLESDAKLSYVVKSAGVIEILAAPSGNVIATLYAAPSPWVVRLHSGETFSFAGLPPGKCRVMTWHPRLPGSETIVEVFPEHVREVTATVGVNSLPKIDRQNR